MSEPHAAADQIRRLLETDARFQAISGATAFRPADPKRKWTDCGFFSFVRDGRILMVSVEDTGLMDDSLAVAARQPERGADGREG